jgi:hypothetical protein
MQTWHKLSVWKVDGAWNSDSSERVRQQFTWTCGISIYFHITKHSDVCGIYSDVTGSLDCSTYRSEVDQLLQIMDAVKEWATTLINNATLIWHDHLHVHHATKPSLYSTLLMHNHDLGHEVAFCDGTRGWLPKTITLSLCRLQSRPLISMIGRSTWEGAEIIMSNLTPLTVPSSFLKSCLVHFSEV